MLSYAKTQPLALKITQIKSNQVFFGGWGWGGVLFHKVIMPQVFGLMEEDTIGAEFLEFES